MIVHGAFADGSGWRKVSDLLTAKGLRVSIVQEPITSLADDVAATRRVLALQDGPTILVGHSYGGMVVTAAGGDPKVAGLVYVAAFQPDRGESLAKLAGSKPVVGAPPDTIKATPDGFFFLDPAEFPAAFAADLPKAEAAFMASSQVFAAQAAFREAVGEPAWRTKPSWALVATHALKIETAVVAGYDWGARTADILAALWPQRCKGLVSVSGYLIGSQEANKAPLPPKAEWQWWYQYYFATARGEAGYAKYTKDFARLIWELASPQWRFDDATFARSAASLDNPDHVAISIHNYRWRLDLVPGEAGYDALEAKLAAFPTIGVPTITMEGDANGAPHPEPSAYARRFTGRYEHRLVTGGIGHNLPQEAPRDFARAVLDVARA